MIEAARRCAAMALIEVAIHARTAAMVEAARHCGVMPPIEVARRWSALIEAARRCGGIIDVASLGAAPIEAPVLMEAARRDPALILNLLLILARVSAIVITAPMKHLLTRA